MGPASAIPVKPIRKKGVPEEIINEIKGLIEKGYLIPGNKLPPERELAKMLNVSRPSLREALYALSVLGITENRAGDGTYLSESTDNWHLEPFNILFTINKGTLRNIFEARKFLDAAVAQLASERHCEEDISKLEKSLENMRLNIGNDNKYSLHEMAFHLDLIRASGNAVIYVLMEKLYKLLEETRKKAAEFQEDLKTYRHQDYLNHMKIFEAVKNRKPDEAVKAMIDHLQTFEDVT